MSARNLIPVPEPLAGESEKTYRYWGKQKPPANADVLCAVVVRQVTDEPGKASLRLYGPIDSWGGPWGVSASEVAAALDALDESVTDITVRINSVGGSCFEGLAILNLFRAHPARVTAVVDGIAASAASFIATGVDETVMSPGTTMMIHDPWSSAWGCNAEEMRKAAGVLDKIASSMADLYAEAAGGTADAWRAVMVEETWYTAEEAVAAGLAQRVGVVPDTGQVATAGNDDDTADDDQGEDFDASALFDLSIFNHAGRDNAPAPGVAPGIAAEARDYLRAKTQAPVPPAASADGTSEETEGSSAVTNEQITDDRGTDNVADATASDVSNSAQAGGMVSIPAAALSDLQAQAEQGAAALGRVAALEKRLHEQDRDAFLNSVRDRYLPTNRASWEAEYDRDPEATRAYLAQAPVLIPTSESGHAGEAEITEADALYNEHWGSDEKKGA